MFENFYFMYAMYFVGEIFRSKNVFPKSAFEKMFVY